MKGVSEVIAILLMLVVTIGLVGIAYGYISGLLTAKTGVVLTIDPATSCPSDTITVYVRNDGTATASSVTVSATPSTGGTSTSCTVGSINVPSGSSASCDINRPAAAPVGYYLLRAIGAGSTATGYVYCSTAGT
jgi:flagellin-like protein